VKVRAKSSSTTNTQRGSNQGFFIGWRLVATSCRMVRTPDAQN
jgi:hypothetical protein